jgi:hypothetical protein
MNRLARIVRSSTPSSGALFRRQAYGRSGVREFLRDVLALANASVEGPRYIIVGAEIDAQGSKRMTSINRDDFSGKPAYQAIANDHVEPPVRIRYKPVSVEGKLVGVFEIGDCQDRPYMMRIDYSETLRRGDAYLRVNESIVKMGRRQLQSLFEKKFRDSVSAANIEVGFPGEIIYKDHKLVTCSLEQLPSAIAISKLNQLAQLKGGMQATGTGGTSSMMARLTHARLFGSDSPYQNRTPEELQAEMRKIERSYRHHDNHFLFEQQASNLQLVVLNLGDEPLIDASLSLVMPNHDALHIAERLPKIPRDDVFVDRPPGEQSDYPAVSLRSDSIHVTAKLGDIQPGEPVDVFVTPLRICVGTGLEGRRIGVQYSLFAQNLRTAAKGTLRLLF